MGLFRASIRLSFLAGLSLIPILTWSAEPITVHSQSGQFVVRGLPLGPPPFMPGVTGMVSYLRLDPTLVAVMLERIKTALLDELRLADHWRGAVYVNIQPSPRFNERMHVTSMRHPDNWSYRMTVSEQVDRKRFIKTAVQVVLMELANRRTAGRPVEFPPWLAPGLAAELQTTRFTPLTLEIKTTTVSDGRRADPLRHVREMFRNQTPLRFDELNFPPAESEMTEAQAELFEQCSHLFVHQLLEMREGRENLGRMVQSLADSLNWQTTFLRAFEPHFPKLVDVDKWWALNVVLVTGREMFSLWPDDEGLRRLTELLLPSVQVRTQRGELPLSTRIKLQTVIEEWPGARQVPLLRSMIQQLDSMRSRLSQRMAPLLDRYRATLDGYVNRRPAFKEPVANQPSPEIQELVRDTVRLLDSLDAQRDSLKGQLEAAGQANVESPRR